MHRSGTSLTARLLQLSGLDLGEEKDMMPPASSNPAGHWENLRIVDLNDRILATLGGSWLEPPVFPPRWVESPTMAELREEATALISDVFGARETWGWKDPRTSLTVPFWRAIVPDLRFVICARNPLSVAASLHARDRVSPQTSLALWRLYIQRALVTTHSIPHMVVFYEDLMSRNPKLMKNLLALACLPPMTPGNYRTMFRAIDAKLQHHTQTFHDVITSSDVPLDVKLLYDGIRHRLAVTEAHLRPVSQHDWKTRPIVSANRYPHVEREGARAEVVRAVVE
jgi:hypothetical protein